MHIKQHSYNLRKYRLLITAFNLITKQNTDGKNITIYKGNMIGWNVGDEKEGILHTFYIYSRNFRRNIIRNSSF